ncbi:MAG: complex I subunit 5 family protein [Marinobacter sp.]
MSLGMKLLVALAVGLPLLWLVPVIVAGRRTRWGLPLLPLPALMLALVSGEGWQWPLPWLLLDGIWLLDDLRRVFLVLTALLWCCAGLFAVGYLERVHQRRFLVFWCLSLCGNLGLILASDVGSFYSFFALMTFASYGLVVHDGTANALRAGRVYMAMAVMGEMLLLAGLMLAVAVADSGRLADLPAAVAQAQNRHLITALLVTGFGVKAGLPLLHFWLPLAHPVAPTPASAVLSGAMIKAGLLGWLLTLPLGHEALEGWGNLLVGAGAVAALGGALVGVCQNQPKAVLAYSSISQMGLMLLLVGAALATPDRADLMVPVVALYALHHGLAKGALFLATAVQLPAQGRGRGLFWLLIALPGFSLAGLPFTSGALSKLALKEALAGDQLAMAAAPALTVIMSAGAVATLLLVLRFLWLQHRHGTRGQNPPALTLGWLLTVACSLLLFWWLPWQVDGLVKPPHWLPEPYQYLGLLWPILAALVTGALAAAWISRAPRIPPGDLLVPLQAMTRRLLLHLNVPAVRPPAEPGTLIRRWPQLPCWSSAVEQRLRAGATLALAVLVLLMVALV